MNGGSQDIATLAARARSGGRGAALLLLCGLSAGTGHAQDAAPAAGAPQKNSLSAADAAEAAEEAKDEILVTGHQQHGAVATDIPPETSLNATAIHALGAADLEEVFEDLAPEIKNSSTEAGAQSQTPIVLVNGQRIAGFSSIRDLPPEAVRRIEIFPEKVALQYGYAPDQRVVNIVLRTRYRALTVLGRYTVAPDNWRGIYRAKVDMLRIGENSHWNVDLDFHHEDPIFSGTTLSGPPLTATGDAAVPAHTLAAQDDQLTISGTMNRMFGPVTAELTGRLNLDAVQSRPGLSDLDGDLLDQEGLSNLITGPLNRVDRTVDAQTSLTLNGKLDTWRWSFIGKLDEMTRVTRTGDATSDAGMDTILLPSPGLLGQRCTVAPSTVVDTAADCVSTTTRTASGDFYLNGNLFAMPAGKVTASLRTGFAFSGIRSDSILAQQANNLSRNEGNAQANLDFPITSRNSGIGKLSVGVNGEVRQLSDFGTLSTYGSSLEWAPIEPVNILATYSRSEEAPSLTQLGEAALVTPDLREYDFVQGNTAIIQRIEGGNLDLKRETTQTGKLRLQVKPIRATDLTLSAEYAIDRTRNPIVSLTAATAATMAAFPDLYTRSDSGYLIGQDISPVNLASRDRQQIRWGLNYSTAFGKARPAANPTSPPLRNQFQIALYDTWRLQDRVVLQPGLPSLNLLGSDLISDRGGTPTHEVELQTTVSTGPWSADINAVWQTPTSATAGALAQQQRLSFSQGVTLNMRITVNLADQHWLTRRLPFLRGNLNISADNLLGAHTKVHDSNGTVPPAYGESYLNPTGRTFRITLRKRFR